MRVAERPEAALMEETTPSILQGKRGVSNLERRHSTYMRSSQPKKTPPTSVGASKPVEPGIDNEKVMQLRSLAHDLSNALEGILQACYLLSHAELSADNRRWVQLIDTSSQDAARINREIRASLRALSSE